MKSKIDRTRIAGIVIIAVAACLVLHEFVIRSVAAPSGDADTGTEMEIDIDIDLGPIDTIKVDEKKEPRCC